MIGVFRRALGDFIRHRFFHGVCLFTIVLAVFIVSAFALFFINAGDLMAAWQRGVRITAYLEADIEKEQARAAAEAIKQYEGVDTVSYVPREEGFAWLKDQLGPHSSLLSDLKGNPLPDALEISIIRELEDGEVLDRLAEKITGRPEVADVEYARKWLHRFYGIYNLFRITAFVMAGLVFVAIMFIVANTMRLILYSRREEIEITRIIGADEEFIKYPLYLEAAMLGLLGGLGGTGLLYAGYLAVMPKFSSGGLLQFFQVRFIPPELTVFIIISSMLVGWLGCYFTIRRFLRI
ncbi:MAG: ABC transporter permease [Desulfobacteraceae bacterium]|nr:ABC transporter permease [Desulfobacteraceae bacterium]MCF8094515.1 ABC transporter permease [Desulfobacteraceae bacterium]